MKREIRGLKRKTFFYDYNLYRVDVPIPDAPGHNLSVIDMWPEKVRQTIVFQHGFAGVGESWEFQINHFVQNYRVVVPDLRGHGQSDAPYTQYTMEELVTDMHAIVTALNLPERFILVGHSFGGSVCVEYANAHPERLEKLVLVATAGEYPLPGAVSIISRIPTSLVRPIWRYRPRWDAEPHVLKRMLLNNLRRWQGWPKMRNIKTETLVITGERDNYFPRYVFDDVGNMIPNAEVQDVGTAKHKVQLERRDAVNRAIERFVEGQRGSWRGQQSEREELFSDRPWIANYGKDTPATIPIPRQPLHKFLESAADWQPKQTATVFYGKKLNYDKLNKLTNQLAHALMKLGLGQGDRVMVVLPNMPEMVIAYYAVMKIGAVVVLPNPDANTESILHQTHQTNSKVFITLSTYSSLAAVIQRETSVETTVFVNIHTVLAEGVYKQILKSTKASTEQQIDPVQIGSYFYDLIADEPDTDPEILVDCHELACISYTSGTTDSPKGVCLTHMNLVANTLQNRQWIPDLRYGKEVVLSVVPFLHSYGMTTAMNVPIIMAATMVILSVFDLKQVLDNIKRYRPTLFPGIPSMYIAINQAPEVRSYGLSSIKACISGAAPLPVEVQEAFEKLTRGRLVEGYGLTEASPVTHANPLYGVRKVGSIGVPLPNTDAKIVDLVTGEEVGPGEIGELLVSGPQVMQGYWEDQYNDEPESALQEGWLYTGDVAVMDNEGYFQVVARKRDTIMTGTFSVYPRDVEEVLYENNKVMEAAVVGIGQENGDQRVKAYIVPRPNTRLSKEELIELCRRRLDEYAVPYDIEFRQELPRSFVGKVLRRLLTEDKHKADYEQGDESIMEGLEPEPKPSE